MTDLRVIKDLSVLKDRKDRKVIKVILVTHRQDQVVREVLHLRVTVVDKEVKVPLIQVQKDQRVLRSKAQVVMEVQQDHKVTMDQKVLRVQKVRKVLKDVKDTKV
jgi:hypothetical protein